MSSSDKLDEALLRLSNHQALLGESMNTLTQKIDDLLTRVTPMFSSPSSSYTPPPPPVPTQSHKMKLEVPRFDGTEPLGWIFKINQFFEYHRTPENERLTIASFYMERRALSWFQWMTANGQFTPWTMFLQALQTRFAPSQYDDPTGALFKLTQRGLVT